MCSLLISGTLWPSCLHGPGDIIPLAFKGPLSAKSSIPRWERPKSTHCTRNWNSILFLNAVSYRPYAFGIYDLVCPIVSANNSSPGIFSRQYIVVAGRLFCMNLVPSAKLEWHVWSASLNAVCKCEKFLCVPQILLASICISIYQSMYLSSRLRLVALVTTSSTWPEPKLVWEGKMNWTCWSRHE